MRKLKKIMSAFIAVSVAVSSAMTFPVFSENNSGSSERKYEQLDRGLKAMQTDEGIYLSWRYFKNEGSFYVYRDGEQIAGVDKSTNYLDKKGSVSSVYTVAEVNGDKVGEQCAGVTAFSSGSNYFDIPLDKPQDITLSDGETYVYSAGDASCGDLDGDGEYEIIVKWDANAKDNSQSGYTGNVLIDAYKLNGKKLWRIDLGKNIRGGAHYTQFMVYDLDGDGKAEVAMKTAPGSIDGTGAFVNTKSLDTTVKSGDNSKTYITDGGYILSGPEYYTVFKGSSGEALDTISYPVLRGFDKNNSMDGIWGDTYGNRGDRFLSGIAHLDGITPSIILWRGYYFGKDSGPGRTGIVSVSFNNGRMSVDNYFDTYSKALNGYTAGNEKYIGQGNHSLAVGDMDGDGCDEVVSGSLCLDNDFTVKWCTGLGHGDAHHLAEYDPTNESLEYFVVHESAPYGMSVIDSVTGEVLYHADGSSDTGRGMMANVGAGGYYQMYSARNSAVSGMGDNNFVPSSLTGSMNFRIFWDGDLYDELLDGTAITDYQDGAMRNIFTAYGCVSVNGTKANPSLQADLFGDWREEVVYPLSNNSALRVFTTNIMTDYKIPTLMHDNLYRSGVASENTAYNQPPHIGYYISEDDFNAKVTELEIESMPSKTEYRLLEDLDFSDMVLKAKLDDGTEITVTEYILSGYDNYNAGTQEIEITYRGMSEKINVVVLTDMIIDNGVVKKYTGTDESVVVPRSSDGIPVKSIAAGAFTDSGIKEINIPAGVDEIAPGAFANDIKIIASKGSAAHIYAIEHDMDMELSEGNMLDAYVDVSFDEEIYSEYNDILIQSNVLQEETIDGLLYHVGGRNRGGGDGYTGFSLNSGDTGKYLKATAGRFSTAGRNAILTFNNAPTFENGLDYVFSADICFPEDLYDAAIALKISDGASVITEISKEGLGIDYDTWYKYSLIYHNEGYIQIVYDMSGKIISMKNIASNVMSIAKIEFVASPNRLGNNQSTSVYLDNIRICSSECAVSTVKIKVLGDYSDYISGAEITLGDAELTSGAYGTAAVSLPSDVYPLKVSAQNCEDFEKIISLGKREFSYEVKLRETYIPAEKIQCADTLDIKRGCSAFLGAAVIPDNASIKGLSYLSSAPDVVYVSENGEIVALSAGEAVISVVCDNNGNDNSVIRKECTVTVTEPEDLSEIASVEIFGGNNIIYKGEKSRPFNALVYDFAGNTVSEAVEWTSLTDGVSIEDNIVTVSAECKSDKAVIRASVNGVYAEKEIAVKDIPMNNIANITFNEDAYKGILITINTKDTANIDILNTSFGVGTRTNGADTSTGLEIVTNGENNYLRGFAGRFYASNRNSYMNIATSDMSNDKIYIFTMDIMLDKETSCLNISDDSQNLRNSYIGVQEDNLEVGKWYKMKMFYVNGNINQYFISEDGEIVSAKQYTSEIKAFSHFDFFTSDSSVSSGVCIDNISINTSDDIYGSAVIRVLSETGEPICNAEVVCGAASFKTDTDGCAYITTEYGTYNIIINADGYPERRIIAEISDNEELYEVKLGLMDIDTEFFGNLAVVSTDNQSGREIQAKVICAGYTDEALSDICIKDVVFSKGINSITVDTVKNYDNLKIFVWSDWVVPESYSIEKSIK